MEKIKHPAEKKQVLFQPGVFCRINIIF